MQKIFPNVYCYVDKFNLPDLSKLHKSINIIYRNYDNLNYLDDLLKLKSYCRKKSKKLYLSNNIKLSIKLGLAGVYIPSFNNQLNYCGIYDLPINFRIIGSAHNMREIRIKNTQGCKEIFLSPIFKNNKSKKNLGIIKFSIIKLSCKTNLIALGGINEHNFKKLKPLGLNGFASISWAKKNGLSNLRPF